MILPNNPQAAKALLGIAADLASSCGIIPEAITHTIYGMKLNEDEWSWRAFAPKRRHVAIIRFRKRFNPPPRRPGVSIVYGQVVPGELSAVLRFNALSWKNPTAELRHADPTRDGDIHTVMTLWQSGGDNEPDWVPPKARQRLCAWLGDNNPWDV